MFLSADRSSGVYFVSLTLFMLVHSRFRPPIGLQGISLVSASRETFRHKVCEAMQSSRDTCLTGGQFCWNPGLPDPALQPRHSHRPAHGMSGLRTRLVVIMLKMSGSLHVFFFVSLILPGCSFHGNGKKHWKIFGTLVSSLKQRRPAVPPISRGSSAG